MFPAAVLADVRLDESRLRKARTLRRRGVVLSDLVRKAIDAMQNQGADTSEVAVPGLEDLSRGSSVIDAEFKFDLMDYLSRSPNAPVRSLADILARGAYHASLEASFKRRNAVEARETEAYRRSRVKRDAVRAVVVATMDEQKLDALAYPVLRRKAALIGEHYPNKRVQVQPRRVAGEASARTPCLYADDGHRGLGNGTGGFRPGLDRPERVHLQASRTRHHPRSRSASAT